MLIKKVQTECKHLIDKGKLPIAIRTNIGAWHQLASEWHMGCDFTPEGVFYQHLNPFIIGNTAVILRTYNDDTLPRFGYRILCDDSGFPSFMEEIKGDD